MVRPLVLVHGAWLGGWCWQETSDMLRTAGVRVYAPSLTGLGDRADLASPAVGLGTHVADVVGLLQREDLRDTLLLGHSYSGLVIGGVAARCAGRISGLVFLAANLPHDGRSLLDSWSERGRAWMRNEVDAKGAGWRIPVPDDVTELAPDLTPKQLARTRARLAPQPFKTFTEPARIDDTLARLPRTYIQCARDGARVPDEVTELSGWRLRTLDSGHWPMLSMPHELAALLLEFVARP